MSLNLKNQIACKVWRENKSPRKVLAIRLQAIGDTVITLPYLLSLKKQYPETEIHFLTRQEVSAIPKSIVLFEKVFALGGERNTILQFLFLLLMLPRLWMERYDMVIDLQNNWITKTVRRLLSTRSWSEFDKYSPISAGERTRLTLEAAGFRNLRIEKDFKIENLGSIIREKLQGNRDRKLVVLNPAGAFDTRHWPLTNYVSLALLLKQKYKNIQFLLLGEEDRMKTQGDYLKNHLSEDIIDLTGKTNAAEAFAVLQISSLMITEDSGLMHMAWVQGVPTLALFGSSRHDWSAPLGEWSVCLHSSDLPCGNCMLKVCKYGDNHCLTRYTPEMVFAKAESLIR